MARIAQSLAILRDQINAAHPGRSKVSDGWIGDASHKAHKSDHNPNAAGVVQGLDITHDPANGVDSYELAETLRLNRDHRLKYVISNRRIFSSDEAVRLKQVRGPAWEWRPYSGVNAHSQHMHVSVLDARYDEPGPWRLTPIPQQTGKNMKIENVTATVFGTPSDGLSDDDTAYSDVAPGWANRLGCAYPYRFTGPRPTLRLTNRATGKTVDAPVIDVGPWNKTDNWLLSGTRPRVERLFRDKQPDDYGRIPRNDAGIDLTPATAAALGLNGKGKVDVELVTGATEPEFLPPMDTSKDAVLAAVLEQNRLLRVLIQQITAGGTPLLPPPADKPPDHPPPLDTGKTEPANTEPAKPGVGSDFITSLMTLFGAVGLQLTGAAPASIGDHATTAGIWTTLIPIAATALTYFTGSGVTGSLLSGLLGGLAKVLPQPK